MSGGDLPLRVACAFREAAFLVILAAALSGATERVDRTGMVANGGNGD